MDGNNPLVDCDFGFPISPGTSWGLSNGLSTTLTDNNISTRSESAVKPARTIYSAPSKEESTETRISPGKAQEIVLGAKESIQKKRAHRLPPVTRSTTDEKPSTAQYKSQQPLQSKYAWQDVADGIEGISLESTKVAKPLPATTDSKTNGRLISPTTFQPEPKPTKTTQRITNSIAEEKKNRIFGGIEQYIRENFPQVTQVHIGMNVEKDLKFDDVDRANLFDFIMKEFNIELELEIIWELKDLQLIVDLIFSKVSELNELNIRSHAAAHQAKSKILAALDSVL